MNTQWNGDTSGVVYGSRAQPSVRDAQAAQEIASEQIHAAFATLTLDEQATEADALYDQYAHPTRICWSDLAFALVILFLGAFLLGHDRSLYGQYEQGAITGSVGLAVLYYVSEFARSVFWRIRTRRESV